MAEHVTQFLKESRKTVFCSVTTNKPPPHLCGPNANKKIGFPKSLGKDKKRKMIEKERDKKEKADIKRKIISRFFKDLDISNIYLWPK